MNPLLAFVALALLPSRPAATAASPDPTASPTAPVRFDLYHDAGYCVSRSASSPGRRDDPASCFEACAANGGGTSAEELVAADWWRGSCTCRYGDCVLWSACYPGAEAAVVVRDGRGGRGTVPPPEPTPCREALASLGEEYRDGFGRNVSIVRSSSAVASLAASFLLVALLLRSREGAGTTYHRLLLGMSCSDVLLALGYATFGAAAPAEFGYLIWNARGSRASCDAFGFALTLGWYSGLPYRCALSIYYVARIKLGAGLGLGSGDRTDGLIAEKVEPWLHGVPVLFGLIWSVVLVATEGISAQPDGICSFGPSALPHCEGYGDREVPAGFDAPCRVGQASSAYEDSVVILGMIGTWVISPIVIAISLWTIYESPSSSDMFPIAAAYSLAYILTFIWGIIGDTIVTVLGIRPPEVYYYLVWFFQPLQGLWTLLIYVGGGDDPPGRGRRRSPVSPVAPEEADAAGGGGTDAIPPPEDEEGLGEPLLLPKSKTVN